MKRCNEQQEHPEPPSAPVAGSGFIGCAEDKQAFHRALTSFLIRIYGRTRPTSTFQQNLSPDPVRLLQVWAKNKHVFLSSGGGVQIQILSEDIHKKEYVGENDVLVCLAALIMAQGSNQSLGYAIRPGSEGPEAEVALVGVLTTQPQSRR